MREEDIKKLLYNKYIFPQKDVDYNYIKSRLIRSHCSHTSPKDKDDEKKMVTNENKQSTSIN